MIRIYHTSDLHNHGGFGPKLQTLRKDEPGLLFDCGDSLRGSQTVYHRDEPIIAQIDAAGYDAQAIGNREFHYLFGLLQARSAQMKHPLICTNLLDTKGRTLPFERSRVIEYHGTRVHLLGLLIMQYPIGSPWERIFGWRFLDPRAVVAEYAQNLAAGDMLVVLSHLGLSLDRTLAAAVPRIDLLLGGHSHDTLHRPEYIGGVPIVHAGPYGQYLSRSEIEYDEARKRFEVLRFDLLPLL
ncbi:MAG: metallophosphoesterase [Candidatus Baltobacteraceae bacterium]